ncbi:glycoside hydrolase superfamily [Rhodocollybia butyracea]|uniref:Alpha-galactosidase n=1 Tax=Rhodocollybia butyracea TaxID=206335 RepID=A0A9P5PZF1_9AGAR|nr:glycoside hydrolase superfamily [Rhodocollybia butyracea]
MFVPRAATVAAAAASSVPLFSLTVDQTPNGFNSAARGWNSWGIEDNPATDPSFVFDQTHIEQQCDILATSGLINLGYTTCSVDFGWSLDSGDANGRVIANSSLFDMADLGDHLHSEGLLLGVYVRPGGWLTDLNKTILGTDITIGSVCTGDNGLNQCNWDYGADGVQQWHNSVVDLFAEWGVDFIKLDFITPGSPQNGANLPANTSLSVVNYHNAIAQSGRQMRLDISWKLARDDVDFAIWQSNSESFRTDQDINNGGTQLDGVDSDDERFTIMTHWIGAGSNLILGSDLTNIDATGMSIISNAEAISVADFAAKNPMRPRNPGTGLGDAQQLQAWIGGPNSTGNAFVVLANYGPDQGSGGFGTSLTGAQNVSVTWADLGINGSFSVRDVWQGQDLGTFDSALSASLGRGRVCWQF